MAIFRVQKTKDFTVMSNHHLKNKDLSLRAKGLLSVMLSLPEEWDYTLKGLAYISKEGIDAVRAAIRELEAFGYVECRRMRNSKGQLTDTEYVIHEQPVLTEPKQEQPILENPTLDNPIQEEPMQGKSTQLNTNKLNTKKSNTDILNTYPIKSHQKEIQDAIGYDEIEKYRQVIKENIEYSVLRVKLKSDITKLDEILDLLTETVCTQKSSLVIAGDTYPSAIVKSKFLKLNSEHIEYVIDCMKSNTTDVRNIKKYLLAALFNAPSTIDSYFTSRVNHDMKHL